MGFLRGVTIFWAYWTNLLMYLVGGAFHLITVYMIYDMFSLFHALVALGFPVVSQLFLIYSITVNIGFLTWYNIFLLSYVGVLLVSFAILLLLIKFVDE